MISNSVDLMGDVELVDQHFIGMFEYFGLQKIEIDGTHYNLLNTGLNTPAWNGILLPNILDINQAHKIEEVFKEKNLPFTWVLNKKTLSPEILKYFQGNNYTHSGDLQGMVYELKNHHEQNIDINNKNIKVITEVEEFKEWLRVLLLSETYKSEEDVYNLFLEKLSKFIGTNNVFIPLAAYDNDKIIATISIFFANDIAGFCYTTTLPEYRKQGIAASLYEASFKILKEMGINKTVIKATPMATHLAESIGFKKCASYIGYTYNH
ncbi:MAG: GNAT family N-acetyltransferase [Rickettsia endosymbiont of Pentastiridius leporinus]